MAAYVIAADMVRLQPDEDQVFRQFLRSVLDEKLDGKTLRSTHDERPNNWGTHAGGSRIAVAVHLGDREELERAATVFRGWVRVRTAYSAFKYGELDWQADPNLPVGINPRGAKKNGLSIDDVIPYDMRRGGGFKFPPDHTNYPWGALEEAVLQAEILSRHGYDAWNWGDQALRRAVQYLYDLSVQYPAANGGPRRTMSGWSWLVNHAYGTRFPASAPAKPGKNMAWTDWTHSGTRTRTQVG